VKQELAASFPVQNVAELKGRDGAGDGETPAPEKAAKQSARRKKRQSEAGSPTNPN